jgi:hypothetical protein
LNKTTPTELLLVAALLITGHQRKSAVKKSCAAPFGQLLIANCYLPFAQW